MREIICLNCGNSKFVKAWNAKACSAYCNLQYWRKNNKEKNILIKKTWRRKNGVLEKGSIEHRHLIANVVKGRMINEKHPNWKGDNVGYRNLHLWVQRNRGKAKYCENSISHKSTRYHWANISGEYRRNLADWKQLCPRCNRNDGVRIATRFTDRGI